MSNSGADSQSSARYRFEGLKDGNPHTTPPLSIQQSRTLKNIGEVSRNRELSKRLLRALQWVAQEELDYVDVMLSFGVIQTFGQYNHIRTHWYPTWAEINQRIYPQDLWWPDSPSQPIIRPLVLQGLTLALEVSVDSGKPLDYYWAVCGNVNNDNPQDRDENRSIRDRDKCRRDKDRDKDIITEPVFSRMYESEHNILLLKCTPPPTD